MASITFTNSGGIDASGPITSEGKNVLTTSDIYNGLDKTTSGSALDARQGKALNDSLSNMVKHTSDLAGSATPINADQLNGHSDSYFAINASAGVSEQGSNYIRYNNGIQICWDVITSDGASHTYESWGGGRLHTETFSPVKPFPKSFVANPSLTWTREYSGTVVFSIGIEFTESGISKMRCWRPDTEYYGFGYVDYIAIGRWK